VAFLIDTNIAIHARDGADWALDRLAEHEGSIVLSAFSLAELQRGLFKDPENTAVRTQRLEMLMRAIPVLPFDAAAAETYGRIIALLGWARGRDYDRMIAAHALSTASVLVTRNVADFRDIPGLAIEAWGS